MNIANIGYSNVNNQLQVEQALENYKKSVEATDESKENSKELVEGYEKSEETVSSESGIYSKENIRKTVEQIEAQRQAAMTQMISDMLGQQANASGLDFIFGKGTSSLTLSDLTQADINEAKASISEGGFWSVDAVATRIMDMAKLLAGGDDSKFSVLKDAVIKGFNGAVSQFGFDSLDEMPDITQQTYTEVMNRFDKWEAEFNGTAETITE
ncbi:MAG: hypothetical protein E7509_01645 [Ruminococcus sp.]|nr:hypothetical protein [Ruminococcus sp.]